MKLRQDYANRLVAEFATEQNHSILVVINIYHLMLLRWNTSKKMMAETFLLKIQFIN